MLSYLPKAAVLHAFHDHKRNTFLAGDERLFPALSVPLPHIYHFLTKYSCAPQTFYSMML